MLTRTLAPLLCLMVTACGNKPIAKDPTGKFVVAQKCTPDTLTETINSATDATLVVAFEATNRDILAQANASNRSTRPFLVVIGDAPDDDTQNDKEELADAVIVGDTGAAAAVDLALLACNGERPPSNSIEIGSRTFTPANRAAGGTARHGPGEFILAMPSPAKTRILTTRPATDEVHQIGFLQTDESSAMQDRIRRDAEAAAGRYPQLQMVVAVTENQGEAGKRAQALITQGCRVLLVATSDPRQSKAVLAAAEQAPGDRVHVLVLDPLLLEHGTCTIGCSQQALGRAAASMVQALLPEGGSMITCLTPDGPQKISMTTGIRALAFCQAMNLPSNKLLSR